MVEKMKINKLKLKNPGFTLVELLVVISIIAILVAVTSGSFLNSQKRSRDTSRKTELKALSDALNMYYADNGKFPTSEMINGLISSQGEFADTSNPNNKIIYMKKVPKGNASNVKPILYKVSTTGKSFRLYTNLENSDDGSCISPSVCSTMGYSVSSGCCYIITSSNVGTTENLN